MRRLGREQARYAFDATLEPALEVDDGESFWLETWDAHRGTITDESVVYGSLRDVFDRLGGANPLTGPVAVRGAAAGDCLAVAIEEILPAPRRGHGYTCTTPAVDPEFEPETVICPIDADKVLLPTAAGAVRLPLEPMIGTLGVAPLDVRPSFEQGADFLGNVDLPDLRAGATVVLRAQVEGGLLFVGDAHLAQGDAEIHRAAIETEADVRLSIHRLEADDAELVGLPQLNAAGFWGSIAAGPGGLEDMIRAAYDDLARRLVGGRGLRRADAYRLLGAAGRIRVGQLVPPLRSVLATISTDLLPVR
jgi:amidase